MSADLSLPKEPHIASTADWLLTNPLRSHHFAASCQYGKMPENKTLTPYFLENTLCNIYLERVDSRCREEAMKDMYWLY